MFSAPVRDKLLEIEDFDRHDRYITELMAIGRNKLVVVLVYWFDLYYITLGIKSNTDIFNSRRRGPWFLIEIWPLLRVKPRCLKEKNSKYKLNMTINKRMGLRDVYDMILNNVNGCFMPY